MTKENNNTGLIIFLIIIILILGVVTYLSLTGTITLSTNNSNNETQETTTNSITEENTNNNEEDFNKFIADITKELGWLFVISTWDKKMFDENYDLLSSNENRQLFIMEYILKNEENYKNFVLIDSMTGNEISEGYPTDEFTIAYYPYKLFNIEYKKFFNEDFDVYNMKKLPNEQYKYDKSNDYVYYYNRRSGSNGKYVSNMTVEDTIYDEETKEYTSSINMIYSERLATEIGSTSGKATIIYTIVNENYILKSFIVK